MKISGFSFVRNGIKLHYPFIESIKSVLPVCDEFIIAVGNSDDGTRDAILNIASPKIKIIDTVWDDQLRKGGEILAQQTNIALDQISGDWGFYIQGDEVIHERDLPKITTACEKYIDDKNTDGLLFSWMHFYGNYNYIAKPGSRGTYPFEVRIIRNDKLIRSYRDAQGFRKYQSNDDLVLEKNPKKLKVRKTNATVYHYAKVRGPVNEMERARHFHSLWHDDHWLNQELGSATEYDYNCAFPLIKFQGTHPKVMQEKIENENWNFDFQKKKIRIPVKYKLLNILESQTGLRPFEFRNYQLLK